MAKRLQHTIQVLYIRIRYSQMIDCRPSLGIGWQKERGGGSGKRFQGNLARGHIFATLHNKRSRSPERNPARSQSLLCADDLSLAIWMPNCYVDNRAGADEAGVLQHSWQCLFQGEN